MPDTYRTPRRAFLAAAAGSLVIRAQASNRVRLGVIGSANRGQALMRAYARFADVDLVAISDVIEPKMDEAAALARELSRPAPEKYMEHERLLDRKDIDAVLIATTEHWHGLPFIQACQAGKHIYVEKPLSHNIVEGRQMCEAARKTGVIAVMGTQQRAAAHFERAVAYVQSGQLGKIPRVHCWNAQKTDRRVGHAPDCDPPTGCHWDRWLGPAPLVAFNPGRLEHRWWMQYGGGEMTDWGAHHIDIVLWAMNATAPTSVACSGRKYLATDLADAPDAFEGTWDFPTFTLTYSYRGFSDYHPTPGRPYDHGICFYGTEATLILDRYGFEVWSTPDHNKPNVPVTSVPRENLGERTNVVGLDGWARRFVDTIKSGGRSPLDVEKSHQATVCCLLGNIAMRTGRTLKWNARNEAIEGDQEASSLLREDRRKAFELPRV
jgi:predicted dehydrogenase